MSETELGREPVELLALTVPKCANKFGCAPCMAGLGLVDTSDLTVNFAQEGGDSGYGALDATETVDFDGVTVEATGTDGRFSYSGATGFSGDDYRYITLDVTAVSDGMDFTQGLAGGGISYASGAGSFSSDRVMSPVNTTTGFRGIRDLTNVAAGKRLQLVYDAADSTNYATDWQGQTITGLQFDLENVIGSAVKVHSIVASADNPIDSQGSECYNTRGTCLDVDNFQARPLAHLTPTEVWAQGETGSHSYSSDSYYLFEADLRIPNDPSGLVFEIGGSGTGIYVGFTSGNLVVRCGDGSASDSATTAKVDVDPSSIEGKQGTLICDFRANGTDNATSKVWFFDVLERTVMLLGEDESASPPANAFGANDYGVGTTVSGLPATEDSSDFNGTIIAARFYSGQREFVDGDTDPYRTTLYFDDGRKAKPSDDIYIMPALSSVSTVPTKINISSADPAYNPLGRRSSVTAALLDFPHTDFSIDPYCKDRSYTPLEQGTFWPRWLVRNKFEKTRALSRVYAGYNGEALSAMRTRSYFLDRINYDGGNVASAVMRDYLALTGFSRAQVPPASTGKLESDMDASQVTMELAGDVTDEYPTAADVRIDEEILNYTGRSYDSGTDITTFTGLTRGTDGSTAASHSTDEGVQICRRYTDARIDTVLEELLIDDSTIPQSLVDIEAFTSEYDDTLSAYQLTTLITQPTSVSKLIGEISLQCAFYLWWDERAQKITMQAIKPLDTVDATFTQESNIIGGSFPSEEKPKERVTTLSFFYNPRDWARDLDDPINYKNQLVAANSSNQDADQYKDLPELREIQSRWLTTEAQANQTASRIAVRYEDVPKYVSLSVDAKDRQYWVGNFATISHDGLQKADGSRDTTRRWLIIEADEVQAGHKQNLTLVDVTLDGRIYKITENSLTTYDADLFADGNGYITDDDGNNPDNTRGATIG